MGKGSGKGKTILFGEHFVVYGLPAIAAGISSETTAEVTRTSKPGWMLVDNRPAMPGYKDEKADEQEVSIRNVIDFTGVDISEKGIRIRFGGNLVCASGIGASAASCVALARALNEEFGLGYDDERINEAAYEGEKGYHGTPSGIDNTASTFGGLVWYIRNLKGGAPLFERMRLEEPVHLVIASTGLTASTKEVVGDVRSEKDQNPEWFEKIENEYNNVVHEGREALLSMNLKKVGGLMDRNHDLLRQLTVSCQELDSLVDAARKSGALGAKMTGTGRGGNMIAIVQNEEAMKIVASALEDAGAAGVWTTSFGI